MNAFEKDKLAVAKGGDVAASSRLRYLHRREQLPPPRPSVHESDCEVEIHENLTNCYTLGWREGRTERTWTARLAMIGTQAIADASRS
jgi:hypothetical protein